MNDFIVVHEARSCPGMEKIVLVEDALDAVSKAILKERERCAKLCEEFKWYEDQFGCDSSDQNIVLAKLIRKGD